MKALEDLKEVMEDTVKKLGKKTDITPQELEYAYKAIDILKDIETIKAMKEAGGEGEYSQRGGMSRNSYNSYEGQSNRGNSYAPIWNQDMGMGMMHPYSMASYRGSYDGMSNRGSYEGNSNDGSYDNMSYAGNSMNSYARRGRDGDGDGRYSEDGSYDYSGRRGRDARGRYTSRDGSYDYSRHSEKELMIEKLETMADVTTDSKTKRAIEQCITKLEQ